MVVGEVEHIKAYLHHLVTELRRRVEAGIGARSLLGVDYSLLIDYAYIGACDGGGDIFIGICKIIAACCRAGVRLIVYYAVDEIVAHGENVHTDRLAGVGSRALGGVFRLAACGHRLLTGAKHEQRRNKSCYSEN